ncbi:MAG: DMT family transporter [Acidobacteriaceae bacterium]|nr:DMT family transporter [Acidobacteriaceae bacterium]
MTARQNPPARWRADLALAFVAFIWGATFVFVKRALTDISTVYFLAVRFSLASACMLLIFAQPFRRMDQRTIGRGLLGGATAGIFLWLGYILQTFGLKYTTAGKSGFLTGLYIVLVPLIGACLYRRWPQARELLGILVATAGMIVLTFPSLDTHLRLNKGDLLTLACAVTFAFHLLVLGHFSKRERFEAVALGQIACAALLSVSSLSLERPQARWTGDVIIAIVLTAVLATAVAFALQTWGQQYTTATRTALIFALEPVFAFVTAAMIGGEPLTLAAVSGGVLILTGIVAVELKPAPNG